MIDWDTIIKFRIVLLIVAGIALVVFLYFQGIGFIISIPIALAIVIIPSFFTFNIEITDDGINVNYLFSLGRSKFIPWDDIENIEFIKYMYREKVLEDILVTRKSGGSIKFSTMKIDRTKLEYIQTKVQELNSWYAVKAGNESSDTFDN